MVKRLQVINIYIIKLKNFQHNFFSNIKKNKDFIFYSIFIYKLL